MKTINSLRSKLFAFTLALMASVSTFAYDEMPPDFKVDGLYYNFLEGDNVEVTHPYRPALPTESTSNAATQDSPDDYANLTELTIPSTVTYEGKVYNVIHIGYAAFDQCDNLTYVDIPSSIKTIGVAAFSNCSSLTSITLKEGLEHIEGNAFADCRLLETITFPNSLKTVGSYAFSFTAWYNNQPNGGVYAGNVFYKYKGDIPQNTSFVIKEGTVSISPDAFIKENRRIDYGLVDVAIPNSVEIIGEYAFSQCRALRSVNIPHEVTTIENYAFSYCKSLTSVTCEIVEPLSLPSDVFFSASVANATLYVPAESVEAYKNADQWKDFGQILPIEPTSYKSQWCDTWNMLVQTGSIYPPLSTPYRYQLAKDTVIGDYTYTAIVSKAINDALDAPHHVAAVRFTDDRKVYIYYDNAEYLLYDFNVQQGDELEVFAGINNYRFGIKTYKCIVTGVEQYACIGCPATITLHVPNHPDDFTEIYRRTQWQEGVGDVYSGFLNGVNGYVPVDGGGSVHLLCAYQGDELKHTGPLYEEYGCGDDAEQSPEDLFPTLWGLQRTEVEYHTDGASSPSLVSFNEYTPTLVNGKWYLYDGRNYLREENNQVLLYSPEFEIYEDVVLYDWALEIGDTLPFTIRPFDDDKSRGAVFRVTDVSTITLLDGKEYKKWTMACGIEYIEGIGAINGEGFGNYFCIQHTAHPATYIDTRLVCASRHGQLLYQMDNAEMERLGAECLCEVETSYKSQWCDTWNVMWFDGMRFDETASTSQYRLGKDTITGDYTYSKFTSRTSVRFTSDRKVYVYYEGFDDNDPYTEDLPTGEYLAYDFSAQVGDTLEVFSGVGTYSTYPCVVDDVETAPSPCVVDDVQADLKTFPLIIKLRPLCEVDGEGNMEISSEEITWIEGVGSPDGFLISNPPCGLVGGGTYALLCAYKGDELKYTGPLYEEYGCEYNAGPFNEKLLGTWRVVGGNEIISISDSIIVFIGLTQKYTASATQLTVERLWIPEEESYRWANCNYTLSNDTLWIDNFMPLLVATYPPTFGPITLVKVKNEDLFPTLWGLQRTSCTKTIGEDEYGTVWGSRSYLMQEIETATIDGKQYLLFGTNNIYDEYCSLWLREENNKILLYSTAQKKDLVLYDFTLNVGDSLPRLYVDYDLSSVVDYDNDEWGLAPLVVTEVSTITLLDGKEYKKWTFDNGMQYVEGIGSFGTCYAHNDFYQLIANAPLSSDVYSQHLVCTSRNGQLLYQMDASEMEQLETECLCEAENPEDLFPTLLGLQRTVCNEYCGDTEDDNSANNTYKQTFDSIFFENDKPYILCNDYLLREEDNKILIYSQLLNKDLVLYDFTLEVGDSLPALYIDWQYHNAFEQPLPYNGEVVDYNEDYDGTIYPADTFVVTDVSNVTLLDGKEYKKWTFDNGMEYVEGIGMYGGRRNGNFFGLIQEIIVPCNPGTHLVCVSKNGKLLYQMDDEEMERLGAECLCEVETSYKSQWCDTWNVLQHSTGINYEPNLGEETWIYYLAQDTIINNHTYTSVYRYWSIKDLSTSAYYASVRFTEDKKVYVYYDDKEYLVYDFLAQVGDTLEVFGGYHYDVNNIMPCVVQEVKTDSMTNRTLMKLYAINVHDGTICNGEFDAIEWIEGVGSTRGFLTEEHPCVVGGLKHWLLCAHKGDELKYTGSLYEKYGCEYNAEAQNNWSDTWCNQWNILSHGYQGPQDPLVAARTSIFWLSNNTVNRDGQEYIPLMCSSSKPDVESTNLIGELRFTEDKQVYFYYDNTEYLLYDFDVQVGDTLDIFGGIELYSYSFVEQKTYPHVITKIDTLDDGRLQITSDAILIFEDGEVGTFEEKQQQIWIEGLGSINGIVHTGINPGIAGNPAIVMLCAYRDDECVYKTDSNDPYWIDYTQLGCVYNEGDFIEGAFPMLSGLQRTVCKEYYGETEDDNSANSIYKQTFDQIFFENDKPYILCNDYLLREEDNKILIYSQLLNKDLVLYDFTLEVGDSLPALYIDYHARNAMDWMPYNLDVVDYYKSFDGTIYPADTFIVTDISNVTLFDGKEYKKWTFNNGMEYVEGIGSFGNRQWSGDFFQLIANRDVPTSLQGEHLVCVSKNNKLLYQMDPVKMDELGAECLCDYDRGPRKDNAKDGQIGGRPTPTQWNQLELDLREMENGTIILRAETFSYTLEDISQQVNNKTYFQLARQSTKDTATTKSFVGALHFGKDEDNRVYFLRDGVEYVLYDFTAEPGDTVEIFAGINNYPQDTTYTHVVTGKDTLENGACRMLLEVVFPEETTTAENAEKVWLAGLGSVDGIVHNAAKRTRNAHAAPSRTAHSSDTQTSVMLCAWREDSCLYTTDHPDYNDIGCIYNQDPTAIEDTHSPSPMTDYQKLLRNGQLLIIHKGKTYNVLGVQIK